MKFTVQSVMCWLRKPLGKRLEMWVGLVNHINMWLGLHCKGRGKALMVLSWGQL